MIAFAKRSDKTQKVLTKIWSNRYIYLMAVPVAAYFLIFRYLPMGWLSIAFYDYKIIKGFSGSEFVGLKNFIQFLNNPQFLKIIWNTISLNLYNMVFVFTAPILFAILLNEIRLNRYKKVVQTISYLPHFLSVVVVVSMIRTFLSPSIGVLNNIMASFGMEKVHFMGQPQYFVPIMILSGIWQGVGWGSIIYLSALTGIDQEQYEAAVIDGANLFRQIWHITIPGISGTIMIMFILQIGNLLNIGFEKVYLLQNAQNTSVSEVLSTYVYRMGMTEQRYSLSTAVGLFNAVISFVLVIAANHFSKKYSETALM